MKIITAQKGETAEYFVSELKKYIVQMSRGSIVPTIEFSDVLPQESKDAILLGTLEELSLNTSDLYDPFIEDIIDIHIENGKGYIAGSNLRSILMGVYKYAKSAGCRFIRPGADGDYVPKVDLMNHSFNYRKKADHPFRGECCEGAISYEHMRDTVYWLPKIGMNMYMIEGLVPFTYMHKWYGHVYNTHLRQKGQCTDYDILEEYINLLEQDVKKTGIQLHTLGHAWLFEGMGIRHDHVTENEKVKLSQDRNFDGLDGFDLSAMVQTSHAATLEDIQRLRKTDPSIVPTCLATIPQVRMTRKLKGVYSLDESEKHTYFADSVGMVSDWRKRGPVYEVPFGTLYCKEVPNLITAGRCTSVTDAMWDVMRVIPCCAVTGQAAGTAAAMTDDFPALDIKQLQEKLSQSGVVLHENDL